MTNNPIAPPATTPLKDSKDNNNPTVISFGCRLNHYESAVLRQQLAGRGDLVVINSCAVTAETERQVKQSLRKWRKQAPDKKIIITGCSAQVNTKQYEQMAEVDMVWGNAEKLAPRETLARTSINPDHHHDNGPPPIKRVQVSNIMALRELSPHFLKIDGEQTRAFLEIQNGCNHRCTFCIIPYGRGNSRSHPSARIVAEAAQLVKNGFQEIVLTGVDIASWRETVGDKTHALPYLISQLLTGVPDLKRLRLSSLDPAEITPDLMALFEPTATNGRLLPHIHLSLQAGNDLILKRMKRRHLRADIINLVATLRARNPSITFGADIIAGFPTEDETMFQDTLRLVKSIPIIFGHIFPYSERTGTPAAKIKNKVDIATRKKRAGQLRAACTANLHHWQQQQQDAVQHILVEQDSDGFLLGHNEYFGYVKAATNMTQNPTIGHNYSRKGRILPVKITGHSAEGLLAQCL